MLSLAPSANRIECLKAKLIPVSIDWLANEVSESNGSCLVIVDIRPSSQHCCSNIQSSENINFTNILLRRLMKGVVPLSTHVSSQQLVQRITERDPACTKLVLYDSCSKEGCVKSELKNHAEVLYKTNCCNGSDASLVYYLDGGFTAFSKHYLHLCNSSSIRGSHSPIGISVSASLPINFPSSYNTRPQLRAQTPLEDEASQFGPPVEVLPFLVLGCARDSSNLALLRKHGVTAVLNVSHNCASHFEELFEYKIIPVQDSHQSDLLIHLDTAFEFIDSIRTKGGKVFVHCHAGISRSATICIAYVMKHIEASLSKAYDFVKQKRPCISPNLHFMGQLLEFERRLQDTSPNKDSPLFHEPTIPVDIESIPVSISIVPQKQKTKLQERFGLHLPLKCTSRADKRSQFKIKLHSASAPSSMDIPVVPEVDETTPTSSSNSITPSIELPSYNYSLMGQHYSSTDGELYAIGHNVQPNTGSLPATPIESPRSKSVTCRTQLLELNLSTKAIDNSIIQLSPCRIVACNGGQCA